MKIPLIVINITIGVMLLLFGLWPFSFWPENGVRWLPDKNGIRLQGQGILYSADPARFSGQNLFGKNALSIEIWLQPEPGPEKHEDHRHYAHILTFYNGKNDDLTIGQWKSNLNIRSGLANADNPNRYKEIGLADALSGDETRYITITSDEKGTAIYSDGILIKSYPRHVLLAKDSGLSEQLVLGNSPAGKNPWTGNLFGLAVYGQSLSAEQVSSHYNAWLQYGSIAFLKGERPALLYLFDEHRGIRVHDDSAAQHHLIIPPTFTVPRNILLGLPARDSWPSRSFFEDLVVNLLGFVPFGYFFSVYLSRVMRLSSRRNVLATILVGGGISLAIELLQVYLPTRSSSLIDLMTNTLGTTLGVLLSRYVPSLSSKPSPPQGERVA